jgi:secondary thiamine-phosphate synthase enzyme
VEIAEAVMITQELRMETTAETDIVDLTPQVARIVSGGAVETGEVLLFVPGSTAALTTIEYEPGVLEDLRRAIERIAPRGISYDHDRAWGDGNGYAHVRAALLGPSLVIPFQARRLLLGTWQQVVLLDFDNRPRTRRILVRIRGE